MKNFSLKKMAAGIAVISLIAILVFYFYPTTGKRQPVSHVNPAFAEYITSYTAGTVSSGTAIRIVLAQEVADAGSIGTDPGVKLFSFSPIVKGQTKWLDSRTIEFKPETRLPSGQQYEVSFALNKVMQVPSQLASFTYSFQVIPQSFEVSIDNIKPHVKTELTRLKAEGLLLTSDFAESSQVEQVLDATQDGTALTISWSHTADGKQHAFTIDNVTRKEQASKVQLSANGKLIGVDQNMSQELIIPALGDFKVINVRVDQGSVQHVVVQFSDPLNERQNLSGLLTIAGLSSLDFEVRDNEVKIYPPVRQTGTKTLVIESGIRNILDYRLKEATTHEIQFEEVKPAVRFVGKGNILPSSEGLILPFEAVNLKSVDVKVIKIYENNILQFLQANSYEGNSELRRVGKPVLRKNLSLESAGVADLGKWNRFSLDLATLINAEPGAIYQVRLSFKQAYTTLLCNAGVEQSLEPLTADADDSWTQPDPDYSYWDSYDEYMYGPDYNWRERDNPCHSSYYSGQRNISRNVLASDLGLMAKRGEDGITHVFVNDLKTTQPLSGVTIELYDFQQQLIGTASSGSDGKVSINSTVIPFALIAKSNAQRGYLKLPDGDALSLSSFDVRGERIQKGLKGYLYGERGVWRPGDSLFLTFILEDKMKLLPPAHPVVMELYNPQGQLTSRLVRSGSENGFYKFSTATSADAPTGNWRAKVKVGGTDFAYPLKIETVKPNRLKINLDFGVDKITAGRNNLSGNLTVSWLHGAPGKNLKAEFEVLLTRAETKFTKYPEYVFDDPTREFYSEAETIFSGATNAEGNAVLNTTLETETNAPGMLTATFRGKVFEESGNFSIDRFTIPYYPYRSFTGIKLPPGDKARGMLLTDTTHRVDVVTIDADGNPVSRDRVELSLYKLRWRSWWDNTDANAVYMYDSYTTLVSSGTISTTNGKGQWSFKVKHPEWGRFLVRAVDPVSGHSTAKIVYIDWPGWAGRARDGGDGATMLTFASDKPTYSIGEKATIVIPGSENGRALVSIENGSRVIQTQWIETKAGDTPYTFEVTSTMTPNVFVHVTQLQPHAQTINDSPIRMYGMIPISAEDPQTRLEPVISMPDVLEPGQEVVIRVSEKSKRRMTYTIAVVDEGLLDLTRFKTPDPWKRFYAREALGVKTWDLYNQVMGAYGARMERLLAIGGDAELAIKEDDAKANRFKPVVKFMGPFTTSGGGNEHRFVMPQYIGSVKTMVVAGFEGAYGSTEKVTPVRKPLMVLATLPRVLGPEENLKLPVTLFTMDASIRNVKVDVKVTGPLALRESTLQVAMAGSDATVNFDLTVLDRLGVGKVEVTATSGNYKATDVIEIEIRNPNPSITRVKDVALEASKTWNGSVAAIGMAGTNSAVLEVSSIPPINLGQRLKYLMQYPYGCLEQVTSAVFPQLYLEQVKALTEEERTLTQNNIRAAIERLKSFTQRDGGFGYWPGVEDADSWATTYAGHFLIEAELKGYHVPQDMMRRWKKYQRNKAQSWRKSQESFSSELIQAYRLYTLALAGEAELSAMNRLREQPAMPATATWMLAAAYVKAGQPEAAKKLISNLPLTVNPYQEMAYSYGSALRDKAIILETLVQLNDRTRGFELVKEISEALSNSSYWMNTQTVAWCLKSVGAFVGSDKRGDLKFSWTYNGKETQANTGLSIAQVNLPVDAKTGALKVVNESNGMLFVRVITQGTPARGDDTEESNNLGLVIEYTDLDGRPLDISRLEQGKEFMAVVTVAHPGTRNNYKNMALNQIFPSGWEINNLRLDESESRISNSQYTYQDIRDDRVYTYFDLAAGKQKTFRVLLTASYAGTYYLPAVSCEAMYDRSVYARKKGRVVEVIKPAGI